MQGHTTCVVANGLAAEAAHLAIAKHQPAEVARMGVGAAEGRANWPSGATGVHPAAWLAWSMSPINEYPR